MCKRFADVISSLRLAKCAVALLITAGVLFTSPSILRAQGTNISEKPKSGMALPGEQCRVHPLDEWTEPEKWAWKQICEGRFANFNSHLGEKPDIKRSHKWSYDYNYESEDDYKWSYDYEYEWADDYRWSDGRRTLTSSFLKTILLHEPFRSSIPHRGVRINGAYFKDKIDLNDAPIERLLGLVSSLFKSLVAMQRLTTPKVISFDGSRFDGELDMNSSVIGGHLFMGKVAEFNDVDLSGADIGGQLQMDSSRFKGKLDMDSASVGGNLYMRNGAQFREVVLRNAKVDGQLEMDDSTFEGMLNMSSTSIRNSLLMRNSEFKEALLLGLKVGKQLSMIGSTFEGKLEMDSTSVGSNLLMRNAQFKEALLLELKVGKQLSMIGSTFEGKLNMDSTSVGSSLLMRNAQFKEARLAGLKVGNQLEMDGTKFKGTLIMNNVSIGSSFFMRNATFDKPASLTFLNVGSNLDARGATLSGLDLRGTRIEGELRLGRSLTKKTEWKGSFPKFTLRNARVGALQDTEDSWPDNLEREFEGFIYQRLGGLGMNEKETPYERSSKWFIDWLSKDKSYSPQPYLQLAGVLRTAGYEYKADDVLYASRERELRDSKTSPRKWRVLSVLKVTIGYGYGFRYFRLLYWVLGLLVIGTFLLFINLEKDNDGKKIGFWYSLDMLLPVIKLREKHYKMDLQTPVKYYFYFHQIMGYLLIFFLIAGLSGIME